MGGLQHLHDIAVAGKTRQSGLHWAKLSSSTVPEQARSVLQCLGGVLVQARTIRVAGWVWSVLQGTR